MVLRNVVIIDLITLKAIFENIPVSTHLSQEFLLAVKYLYPQSYLFFKALR